MAEGEVNEVAKAASALENKGTEEVDLDSISDIPVEISAVLGRTTMPVSQLLKLGRGAVVKLNRKVGEPIDIYVNNRMVARGEVVIVENRIGITMTEIIRSEKE
jgi:flagellar motor switch protein FliN/FliY